jgi:hypothetical protein
MRKLFSLPTLMVIALIAATAQADTIRLKNGSVLKGRVTSFSDDQFVVRIDSGSGRYMSTATIHIADIAKIDFESTSGIASDSTARESSTTTQPEESAPRTNGSAKEAAKENPPAVKESAKETPTPPVNPSLNNTKRGKTQPKPEVTDPPVTKESDTTQPEKSATPEVSTTIPETRKPLGPNARTVNVEVAAKRDWTSSGVIVKRGDKIRITATGSITLDPSGQASGPEGTDAPDSRKLITDKPTGGLIGVIGADNDEFIFIGRITEFTATRDGLLFLSVNEGTLSDNSGSFKAVIEIAAQRQATR